MRLQRTHKEASPCMRTLSLHSVDGVEVESSGLSFSDIMDTLASRPLTLVLRWVLAQPAGWDRQPTTRRQALPLPYPAARGMVPSQQRPPSPPPRAESERGPDELPPGWEAHVSRSSGETYYFNSRTGENTYDRPGGVDVHASSASLHASSGSMRARTPRTAAAGSDGAEMGAIAEMEAALAVGDLETAERAAARAEQLGRAENGGQSVSIASMSTSEHMAHSSSNVWERLASERTLNRSPSEDASVQNGRSKSPAATVDGVRRRVGQRRENRKAVVSALEKAQALPLLDWSVTTVGLWLTGIGLSRYCGHFRRHGIDGESLLRLGQLPSSQWPWAVLEMIGVRPIAHRTLIVQELARLPHWVHPTGSPVGAATLSSSSPRSPTAAEALSPMETREMKRLAARVEQAKSKALQGKMMLSDSDESLREAQAEMQRFSRTRGRLSEFGSLDDAAECSFAPKVRPRPPPTTFRYHFAPSSQGASVIACRSAASRLRRSTVAPPCTRRLGRATCSSTRRATTMSAATSWTTPSLVTRWSAALLPRCGGEKRGGMYEPNALLAVVSPSQTHRGFAVGAADKRGQSKQVTALLIP